MAYTHDVSNHGLAARPNCTLTLILALTLTLLSLIIGTADPGVKDPCREVQRLVAQCWNRGCHHANFSRSMLAARFMSLALRLLDACPDLQHRKVRFWHAPVP